MQTMGQHRRVHLAGWLVACVALAIAITVVPVVHVVAIDDAVGSAEKPVQGSAQPSLGDDGIAGPFSSDSSRSAADSATDDEPDEDVLPRKAPTKDDARSVQPLPKRPIILIPGLASSILRVAHLDEDSPCEGGFGAGYRGNVWANPTLANTALNCFIDCMSLHPENSSDHACGVRPDEGLDAITSLTPGTMTETISEVFGSLISDLADQGYSTRSELVALPYDWRLPMHQLEQRDGFFMDMKSTIEIATEKRRRRMQRRMFAMDSGKSLDPEGNGVVILAHSLGNLVLRYFFDWLLNEVGMNHFHTWVDKHIYMYVAVASAWNGAEETYQGVMTGLTSGFPISKKTAQTLQVTWGSIPLQFRTNMSHDTARFTCDRCRGTPDHKDPVVMNVTVPSGEVMALRVGDLLNDEIWEGIAEVDPIINHVRTHLKIHQQFSGVGKYYEFTDSLREPWARPPVKRIICAYGTGIKTPIHSTYVPYVNGTAGYVRTRTVYEERDQHFEVLHGYTSDTELWRHQVTEKPGLRKAVKPGDDASAEPEYVYHRPPTSGDGTAPYDSLSWCHNWLSPTGQVSVTTVPQDRYALIGLAETKRSHASRRNGNGGKPIDIGASMPFQKSGKASLPEGGAYAFTPGDAVNVFYEEAHCGPRGTCASTSVWELDGQVHRDILRGDVLLRELQAELESMERAQWARAEHNRVAKRHTFQDRHNTVHKRLYLHRPKSEKDCYWDYAKVGCFPRPWCMYKYRFGDVHLTQSCRMNKTHSSKKGILDQIVHAVIPSAHATDQVEVPLNDIDCYFDFKAAVCAPQKYCSYRYTLGDFTLSQSCKMNPQTSIPKRPITSGAASEGGKVDVADSTDDVQGRDSESRARDDTNEALQPDVRSETRNGGDDADPCATGDQIKCRDKLRGILGVNNNAPCKVENLLSRVEQCKSGGSSHDELQACLDSGKSLCFCIDSVQTFRLCMGECLTLARSVLCAEGDEASVGLPRDVHHDEI